MFRYLLIDEDGIVTGTDSTELAHKCAEECDQFLVFDCETRKIFGEVEIKETEVKLEHFDRE